VTGWNSPSGLPAVRALAAMDEGVYDLLKSVTTATSDADRISRLHRYLPLPLLADPATAPALLVRQHPGIVIDIYELALAKYGAVMTEKQGLVLKTALARARAFNGDINGALLAHLEIVPLLEKSLGESHWLTFQVRYVANNINYACNTCTDCLSSPK
jgi:hypothetical protein